MNLEQELVENVERGIILLNNALRHIKPNWINVIDLDKLSLGDGIDCVLGQYFSDYFLGLAKLGLPDNGTNDTKIAYSFGFYPTKQPPYNDDGVLESHELESKYAANSDILTQIWREKIEKMRVAAG